MNASVRPPHFDDSLVDPKSLPPHLLHGMARPPRIEVLLAQRSHKQGEIHARLRREGVRAAELPDGARFVAAVQQSAQPPAAACSTGDYERMKALSALLTQAGRGLSRWWEERGQASFKKHGQWGIWDAVYKEMKVQFYYEWLCKYMARRPIRTICELGFMSGHSALLFLETVKAAKVVSFDLGDCSWTRPQGELLRAAYGAERFELELGLSNNTVPLYARRHPRLQCDVVMVDGSKFTEPRWQDLLTFRKLGGPGAVLFYDEAVTMACVNGSVPEFHHKCRGLEGAAVAYNRAVRRKLVRLVDCKWAREAQGEGYAWNGDGSCVAEYL